MTVTAHRCIYTFPADASIPINASLTLTMGVSGLHIAQYPKVNGEVSNYNPSALQGEWIIGTTLFSNLPGQTDRPVLEILGLTSALGSMAGPHSV